MKQGGLEGTLWTFAEYKYSSLFGTDRLSKKSVKLRFYKRFIYVGVDISIYALLTGGRS